MIFPSKVKMRKIDKFCKKKYQEKSSKALIFCAKIKWTFPLKKIPKNKWKFAVKYNKFSKKKLSKFSSNTVDNLKKIIFEF